MTNCFRASFVDKPESVHLTANISSDKFCTGILINFTCTAEANPQVHAYTLYENDTMIMNVDRSGVWIRPMNTYGLFVYRCEANNSVGTGKSSSTSLTVKGEDTLLIFFFFSERLILVYLKCANKINIKTMSLCKYLWRFPFISVNIVR